MADNDIAKVNISGRLERARTKNMGVLKNNAVKIKKLAGSDEIMISTIIELLEKHFTEKYGTHGGSKLPVIAFYAIYKYLLLDIGRYQGCILAPLGSHTASDRTSRSSGDIEVLKDGGVFEAVEIKLDKRVDITIARIAYEKIARFNPKRYYILSHVGIAKKDRIEIEKLIIEIREIHGCQLIVNGLLYTLKYYLRLISSPKAFFNEYIRLVEMDDELKICHKNKLKELIMGFLS